MFNLSLLENANIRMVKINSRDIFSLYDYLEYALENKAKDKVAAARTFWNEKVKTDHQFQMEISRFLSVTRFQKWDDSQGKYVNCRGALQVGVTMEGLQRITLLLGGKIGQAYRAGVVDLCTRYLAGDRSMISEIEDNAASEEPIHAMARNALSSRHIEIEEGGAGDEVMADTAWTMDDPMDRDTVMRIDQNTREVVLAVQSMVPMVQEFSALAPVVQALRAECAQERHMRHQADGRLSGQVRQANAATLQQAEFWKRQASQERTRGDEERQHVKDCHAQIMRLAELVARPAA